MGGLGTPGAPLIGRDAELTAVTSILGNGVRMLTLTGPPGVGKTRLAAAVAESLADTFAHGAAFADLSPVREPQRAMSEVARCVGLGGGPGERVLERLHQWLGARHLLLVVDNVEQVPGIGPALVGLLTGCPRLHLLVTGRENLHLRLEHEYPVPPLAMPQPDEYDDLERLHANAAVSLFAQRARAVRPDFTVGAHNAAAVAEICVRLDGLPLALELAAARTKLLTPAEICTRLRQRLVLLDAGVSDVPARHRTLRAAISWSHDLLDDTERALLRRLSVFVGGWNLAAAEQVCADAGTDVLEVVGSLVDKSLLYRVGVAAGESELGMLESIREYAAEQLRAHGEADRTADRHAAYFTALGVEAEAGIGTHDETFWWSWIGRQEGNLRAVLERCLVRGDISSALSVATTMGWYWYTRGYLGEGQATLDEVLQLADAVDAPSAQPPAATLAGANTVAGILSWSRGDGERAGLLLGRALDRSVAAGDIRRTAIASAFLGHVARERGDFEEATQRHELAGRLSDQMGNVRGSAWARYDLGRLALQRGDLDTAGALLRESLMRFRDIGYPWAIAWSSWALGTVAMRRGVLDEASSLLVSALHGFHEVSDQRGVAGCLEALAGVATQRSAHREGARLLGAAARLRLTLSAPLPAAEAAEVDRLADTCRQALGDHLVDQERHSGQTMSLAGALALGREVGSGLHRGAAAPADAVLPTPLLTPRERQVAGLVAAGRTNQQIGTALGIAGRTAEAHVHNIMVKLDAASRSEVAVWAAGHGLLSR